MTTFSLYSDDEVMRLRKVFLLLDTDHSGEMDIDGKGNDFETKLLYSTLTVVCSKEK